MAAGGQSLDHDGRSRACLCCGERRPDARAVSCRTLGEGLASGGMRKEKCPAPLSRPRTSRSRRSFVAFLSLWAVCGGSALADDSTDKKIAESALHEARDVISLELFGHYELIGLSVLKLEALRDRVSLGHDYGLVRVAVGFSAKRNSTKHPAMNPRMFEPGSAMCQGGLYLHCGVPVGHVFEGTLDLLLAVDRDGAWRVVSPHWRSRREYPLDGYLVLEGREREGYVLFPKR